MRKIHLNLNHKDSGTLNENVYSTFAGDVNFLMQSLYGPQAPTMMDPKIAVTGTQAQIMSFFNTLQREKKYMDSFMKHGLNDAQTMNSRYQLQDAVKKFEYETGLRWPFEH